MPTEKRQRKREGQAARKAAALAAARREQRKRRLITLAVLLVVVIGALFLISVLGGDDDGGDGDDRSTTTTTEAGDDQGDAAGAFEFGEGECPPATKPAEAPESFDDAPQNCLTDGTDYAAVVSTSEGEFTIDLAEGDFPGTVNNFVALARWGWYDGDDFHRVIPGFMSQGGDPVGEPQGTGGPGYDITDELPDSVGDYTEGTVAMANSGPDSSGSQFFVCTDCSGLPGPDYSIVGQVTEGLDTVTKINDLGVAAPPSEPTTPITIETIEIVEQ